MTTDELKQSPPSCFEPREGLDKETLDKIAELQATLAGRAPVSSTDEKAKTDE